MKIPTRSLAGLVAGVLLAGTAAVAQQVEQPRTIGVGGLLMVFRIGPMPAEVAAASIRLFMQKVAPQFRTAA